MEGEEQVIEEVEPTEGGEVEGAEGDLLIEALHGASSEEMLAQVQAHIEKGGQVVLLPTDGEFVGTDGPTLLGCVEDALKAIAQLPQGEGFLPGIEIDRDPIEARDITPLSTATQLAETAAQILEKDPSQGKKLAVLQHALKELRRVE